MSKVIRVSAAAEILDLLPYDVRKLVKRGALHPTKDASGTMVFDLEDLYAYNRDAVARRADTVLGLMSVEEAAELLDKSTRTVQRWVKEGYLAQDSKGRVSRATINALQNNREVVQAAEVAYGMIPAKQVIEEYRTSMQTLYNLREAGALVATKIPGDRRLYYSRETLDEVLVSRDGGRKTA